MIVKILGIMDIFAGLSFWTFSSFGILPSSWMTFFGFYLLIKGLVFLLSEHFASGLDVISSFFFFAAPSFIMPEPIVFLVSLFLLIKGIMSLL